MVFDISVGVAKGKTALRDELDGALARHRAEIDAILDEYRIPRGDPAAVLPRMGDAG
jgi:mxaJ protein